MRAERGVVLILFALFAMIFVLFAALAIGIAMVAYSKSEAQIIANAAALAALEGWVHETQSDRMTAANDRANLILQKNQISGLSNPSLGIGKVYLMGQTGADFAGDLAMGRMYPRSPGTDPPECLQGSTPIYPCLVYYEGAPPANAKINAARVRLQIGNYNGVIAPFVPGWIASSLFNLNVEATATAVERCTTFLMDVSMSTTAQTHKSMKALWSAPPPVSPTPSPPAPAVVITRPNIPALYAYRNGNLSPGGVDVNCSDVESEISGNLASRNERRFRCSTRPNRINNRTPYPWDGIPWPGTQTTLPNFDSDPTNYTSYHFWNDYASRDSRYGPIKVDTYVDPQPTDPYQGPEPLRTFLDAMNLALRTLQEQQTSMDLVSIKAFTGRRIDEIPPVLSVSLQSPPPSPAPEPFTNDLGYMTQITNYLNIGTHTFIGGTDQNQPEIHPNFLDHGWFPLWVDDSVPTYGPIMGRTNGVGILDEAIAEMQESCPKNAKKQIILMTDGIWSCSYVTHSGTNTRIATDTTNPTCDGTYDTFLTAEKQLLAGSGGAYPGWSGGDTLTAVNGSGSSFQYPSIIQRLREAEIAVTVLLAGDYVQPNFMNIEDLTPPSPLPAVAASPYPLDYSEAMGLGFTAYPPAGYSVPGYSGVNPSFFDVSPSCGQSSCPNNGDETAFLSVGLPGYIFRRANGIGRLSILTGGLWCPLSPLDIPANYNNGIHMARVPGQPERYAYLQNSPRKMAAECASQAVGYNPYILSEALRVHQSGT